MQLLPGALVEGGLFASGQSEIHIWGGVPGSEFQVRDDSVIRLFGSNWRAIEQSTFDLFTGRRLTTLGHVTGTLLDGTPVDSFYEGIADGAVIAFETFTTSQTIETNYSNSAVVGRGAEPIEVRFRPNSQVSGQLFVAGNARVNFHGVVNYGGVVTVDDSSIILAGPLVQAHPDDGVWARGRSRVTVPRSTSFTAISGNRDGIRASDSSVVNLNGVFGYIYGQTDDGIDTDHQGTVFMRGGDVIGANYGIEAKAVSRVTIMGGTVFGYDDGLSAAGESRIEIRGGDIHGQHVGARGTGQARITVLAGVVMGSDAALNLNGDAQIHWYGGRFDGGITAEGGEIHVYGHQLVLDVDTLSGRLADGRSIAETVLHSPSTQIVLHEGVLHPFD